MAHTTMENSNSTTHMAKASSSATPSFIKEVSKITNSKETQLKRATAIASRDSSKQVTNSKGFLFGKQARSNMSTEGSSIKEINLMAKV